MAEIVEVVTGLTRLDAGTVTIAGLLPSQARPRYGVAPQEIALYLAAPGRPWHG